MGCGKHSHYLTTNSLAIQVLFSNVCVFLIAYSHCIGAYTRLSVTDMISPIDIQKCWLSRVLRESIVRQEFFLFLS